MSSALAPAGNGKARFEVAGLCERLTNPFMMWLVNVLVHAGVMLQAMNPVDGKIVESHVQDWREQQPGPAIVAHVGVEQAFATDLGQEQRQGQKVDEWNGGQR